MWRTVKADWEKKVVEQIEEGNGFQQNQITLAATKTGSDGNNYNRRRNLFRLVFSERRSHGEEKQISYQLGIGRPRRRWGQRSTKPL